MEESRKFSLRKEIRILAILSSMMLSIIACQNDFEFQLTKKNSMWYVAEYDSTKNMVVVQNHVYHFLWYHRYEEFMVWGKRPERYVDNCFAPPFVWDYLPSRMEFIIDRDTMKVLSMANDTLEVLDKTNRRRLFFVNMSYSIPDYWD